MQLFAAIHEDDIAVILYAKGKAHIAFFGCNVWLWPKTVCKKEFQRALTYRGLPSH